jgi:uncharacterized membrane protein
MTHNDQQPTGDAMRRKVRRTTAGVVGAAVVASAVVTAGLAYASGTDAQASLTTSGATTSSPAIEGDDEAEAARPSTPSQLAAPTRAPSGSSGRRHATSGGS